MNLGLHCCWRNNNVAFQKEITGMATTTKQDQRSSSNSKLLPSEYLFLSIYFIVIHSLLIPKCLDSECFSGC